jgi:8-oxo-dGTP diphosphatase
VDERDYEVRAAGGVVVAGEGRGRRVAVVHRPRYDDWSLPKGKLEAGEGFEQAALREIEEETGQRCRIVRELEPNGYRDHKGRSKLVRWFLMEPLDGRFEPSEEVDELRWLAPPEAAALVDYEHDRRLLAGLEDG